MAIKILSEVENKKSFIQNEIEAQKFHNQQLSDMQESIHNQVLDLEKEEVKLKVEKEKLEFLNRRLQKILQIKTGEVQTFRDDKIRNRGIQVEIRINELTKSIEETQEYVRKLQLFWLVEQNNILAVSQERQDQIQKVNLMKKQVLILQQKNYRLSDEIQTIKKSEEHVQQSINILSTKSEVLMNQAFKTKNKKISLSDNNTLIQSSYDIKLKESEMELLALEADLADIEEEKVTLSKELIETNREGLEWEKKMLAVREMCSNLARSRKRGGEIVNLRLMIHKNKVILSGLRKTQEKLLKDLEYCLIRREAIYYGSETIEKREAASLKKAKVNRVRKNVSTKIDSTKNQIKQIRNQINNTKIKMEDTHVKIKKLGKKINTAYTERDSARGVLQDLSIQLDEAKSGRQFKFELLLFKQRKANIYDQILKNRKPYVTYKKLEDLSEEFSKQKAMSSKLLRIVEHLSTDFPNQKNILTRLFNSLGISNIVAYS